MRLDDTEAADLFGKWVAMEGLLGRITQDQCADLARAFLAGWFYAQNPLLRESLRSSPRPHPGHEDSEQQAGEQARKHEGDPS